jgi:hypothetical protein
MIRKHYSLYLSVEMLAFGLACDQVSPCAFAASPRQYSHPHRLSLQSPHALVASLWQRLHSHEQCAIVVGLPSLLGCHCCWAAIVVGPPSLLGRHCHQAAIVVGLPSLLGCHCLQAAIIVGLLSPPRSLGLPPNGLFLLGYIVAPFSWAAFERPVCCHRAVVVPLFLLVRPIVCVSG